MHVYIYIYIYIYIHVTSSAKTSLMDQRDTIENRQF